MTSHKTFFLCLYCLIVVTEILGIPGSSGGGRSGSFSGGRSTGSRGILSSSKNSGKQAFGTNLSGGEVGMGAPRVGLARTGGSFLSAWGIISLVLFIIVGSALTYYISVFYPLICAKRGKYDVMEMTAV